MENITGFPVTDTNYLESRLYLVEEMRDLLRRCSLIIESPRRFGKTSVIKEFIRQNNIEKEKKREFNILFLELEGEDTVNDFSKWKEKITPMITGLNSFGKNTVIIFDEFPDMLQNFKIKGKESEGFKTVTDSLTGWLRSLRQKQDSECKYQFVFCGSINLRKTLEEIGVSKRINDLES